jgi:hypothetical protein
MLKMFGEVTKENYIYLKKKARLNSKNAAYHSRRNTVICS